MHLHVIAASPSPAPHPPSPARGHHRTPRKQNSMARTSTASPSRTHVPLGSLTQPGARAGASCRACGSDRVTRIAMNLTDGSPVEFTSCHRCEHRTWASRAAPAPSPSTGCWTRPARSDQHQPAPERRPRARPLGSPACRSPRSATTCPPFVKAYDVRGLVPDQLDEELARALGAAFVAVVGAAGGAIVVGHDMRPSLARAGRGVRRGRDRPGRRRRRRSGWPRPTSSTSPPASLGPARRDVHRQPQPGAVQRHQAVPRRRRARSGRTPGWPRSATWPSTACPAHDGPAGTVTAAATCSPTTPSYLRSLVDLAGNRPPARSSSTPATAWPGTPCRPCSTGCRVDLVPLYFELDGTFPNHEANPLEPANLRRPAGARSSPSGADIGLAFDGDADRCFVVDERGEPVSPSALTALIAARELAKRPRRDGDPQPDHLAARCPRSSASTAARRCAPGSATRSSRPRWPRPARSSAASTPAHFYFRDFWRADSGMLAALHVLAALGEQDRPLSRAARRRTSATSPPARSTPRSPTRRRRPTAVEAAFAGRAGVDARRARRADRRRPGLVVQRARVQHRAAAAAQRRGARRGRRWSALRDEVLASDLARPTKET